MIAFLALAAAASVPDGQAAQSRPPAHRAEAYLPTYVSDSDYPAEAIRRHEQGTVSFALDVDPSGRVSACRVTASSGSAVLDEATCRILRQRAQFTPARDRRGRPVPDQISSRMRWVLPDRDSSSRALANLASYISDSDYPAAAIRAGEQGTVAFVLDVTPEGLVSDCRVTASSGSASLDSATCRIMRARPRFAPARDRDGNAVPDHVKSRVRWVLPVSTDFDLTAFISTADFPPRAIARREAGRIAVELFVSAEGNVSQCLATEGDAAAPLAVRTCELLQARVRFMPATDAAGHAIPSVVQGYVDWVLPTP